AAGGLGNADAVGADEVGGQQLLLVGDLRERRLDDVPAIGSIAKPADRRHHRASSGDCEFHRRTANSVSLLYIGLGGNVARGSLEVIGDGPMALAAEFGAYQLGDEWRHPAQLSMAESGLSARCREELTGRAPGPFRYGDDAVAVPLESLLDPGQEPRLMERNFGQEQYVWSTALLCSGERASSGRPSSMPAHHFQREHLGRRTTH